ncbi:MAG TPA: flagellar biosynthesis protein FlhB [Pseudomonadales bacterium]|nr:flagellar biosynthesis protein FlhB [Pseudomonadales bacterium]
MAENDSSQEKTEEPTEKRKKDAREKGQIARSRELSMTVVMMAGAVSLLMFGSGIVHGLLDVFKKSYVLTRQDIYEIHIGSNLLVSSGEHALKILLPFFFILFVASIIGPALLGGWLFSVESIQPKFSKLNPIEGVKRIFSAKGLMEMIKAFAKFVVVLLFSILVIYFYFPEIMFIANQDIMVGLAHGASVSAWGFLWLCCSLLLISAIDIPFQLHEYNKQVKMTKQEVKDEMKDSEGKPEVKSKIRQLQMQMAQRRMMSDVATADVVITNPTHFSVALKYNSSMSAPVVVAKGVDNIALKIREVAKENNVVLVQAPPLARAIYHTAELGHEIHADLYMSVAQVLAYVFQLNLHMQGKGDLPDDMLDIAVPESMRFD